MNACSTFASALDDVAAGATPKSELTEHLVACDTCRARLARRQALLARIDSTAQAWMAAEPAPHLASRILARVEAERRQRNATPVRWRLATVAALTTLLAFGGYQGAQRAFSHADTPVVSQWQSPTSALLPDPPAVLDLHSHGRLLDGENHVI